MPHIRLAMSAALAVLGSLACLLVSGLLIALAMLARVERRHEEAMGIRTEDRPVHVGASGDVHLVLGFPAARALDPKFARDVAAVSREDARATLRALVDSLDEATHGHAEFSVFRPIAVRAASDASLVYVHARVRKPVAAFVDLGARDEYRRTLESLAALAPDGIIELRLGRATITTDPALGRPRPLLG